MSSSTAFYDVLADAEQHLVLVQLLRAPSAYLRYVRVCIAHELHQRQLTDVRFLQQYRSEAA
jgi:hypothetical protein